MNQRQPQPPRRLMVINVVGLTWEMIGDDTPHLKALADDGFGRPMQTILPAVTCSVQASMLTGLMPASHGIVANGWYFRDLAEIGFWKQSNHLISGQRTYQAARKRSALHTTAKMFWWYNMYADVDWSVTPRPSYPADGRKVPDIYSDPPALQQSLQAELGNFPLFNFWGPTADIKCSKWIADASLEVWRTQQPSLMLVYLPHLDYNLQRLGPGDPAIRSDIRKVDSEAGKLIQAATQDDADVLVVSEYGITEVNRPVHINRALREAGLLQVRKERLGWETLDAGASQAFAVADHQIAHVYLNPKSSSRYSQLLQQVRTVLERLDGMERVLDRSQQKDFGIDHERSGDLVAVTSSDAWFTYYFWADDKVAPDYARTVDIHRKPGYDPVELFVDPEIRFPRLKVASRLAKKMAGFRYYMDMIGLDASIVKGSHGRIPDENRLENDGPVLLCNNKKVESDRFHVTNVHDLILDLQFPS